MDLEAPVRRPPRPAQVALAGVLALGVSARPGVPAARPAPSTQWQISSMRIVAPGRTTTADDGRHVAGVVFEGLARASHGAFAFDAGTLRLTLSGFAAAGPDEERKGRGWQVEGRWVITPAPRVPVVLAAGRSRGSETGSPAPDLDGVPPAISGTLTGVCSSACFWPFHGIVRANDTVVNGRWLAEVQGTFEGRADATALLVISPH